MAPDASNTGGKVTTTTPARSVPNRPETATWSAGLRPMEVTAWPRCSGSPSARCAKSPPGPPATSRSSPAVCIAASANETACGSPPIDSAASATEARSIRSAPARSASVAPGRRMASIRVSNRSSAASSASAVTSSGVFPSSAVSVSYWLSVSADPASVASRASGLERPLWSHCAPPIPRQAKRARMGPGPAADAVARLEHDDIILPFGQAARGGDTCRACADHHDLGIQKGLGPDDTGHRKRSPARARKARRPVIVRGQPGGASAS